ncbi:ribosome releasing factor, putative [Babesia ovis]|uniref:Ribosome releasing factor, putative n=1 Tax=Babesia ovis TaxID=5869 RepID=A0A9W5TAD3_BABOV|nr:ribosome releasing factor, putative [Babesia ovis]
MALQGMLTLVYLPSLLWIITSIYSNADVKAVALRIPGSGNLGVSAFILSSHRILPSASSLSPTLVASPLLVSTSFNSQHLSLHEFPLNASKKKKGVDRSRSKKGGLDDVDSDAEATAVSEADLDALFAALRAKLKDCEEHLRNKISRLTLHRATPSLVESLTVELPGESKEKQLQYASRIMSKGPYELHVVPLSPNYLDAIFVSLSTKLVDYKVTMQPDRISVVIPSMTDAMIQQARSIVKETQQEVKARIRTARQDLLKKLKAMRKGLSDDMYFRQEKELDSAVKLSEQSVDNVANKALRNLG